jgi:hypothetical protein
MRIADAREQLAFLDTSQQGTGVSIGSVQIRETSDLIGWITGPKRLTRERPWANRPLAIWEANAEMRECVRGGLCGRLRDRCCARDETKYRQAHCRRALSS